MCHLWIICTVYLWRDHTLPTCCQHPSLVLYPGKGWGELAKVAKILWRVPIALLTLWTDEQKMQNQLMIAIIKRYKTVFFQIRLRILECQKLVVFGLVQETQHLLQIVYLNKAMNAEDLASPNCLSLVHLPPGHCCPCFFCYMSHDPCLWGDLNWTIERSATVYFPSL